MAINVADLVRIGQGREAEVFLQPDGTVVKLMRDPRSAGRVRAEFAALEALAATASLVPVPIRLVSIDCTLDTADVYRDELTPR